jgi:glycosyltransferase involved in cell wall biosynthesis
VVIRLTGGQVYEPAVPSRVFMLARMSASPLVTAIVPTRGRPRQVREAIDSILGQRYPGAIECLVVFDGEPPDRDLERMSDGDREVRVLENTRSPGLPGARNTAILAARGELLAICDDDDRWLPDRLDRGAAELARSTDCDVAAGAIRLLYGDREVDRSFAGSRIRLADLLRDRIVAAHSSTLLVRRSAYEEVGLVDEDAPGGYAEDYDWLLRAARAKPIAFVGPPAVALIDRTGSMFADWRRLDRGIQFILGKHPEFAGEPRGLARLLGRRAFSHAALGQRREALALAVRALRHNPTDRRALVSVPIALGLLSAERVQRYAEARGRTA